MILIAHCNHSRLTILYIDFVCLDGTCYVSHRLYPDIRLATTKPTSDFFRSAIFFRLLPFARRYSRRKRLTWANQGTPIINQKYRYQYIPLEHPLISNSLFSALAQRPLHIYKDTWLKSCSFFEKKRHRNTLQYIQSQWPILYHKIGQFKSPGAVAQDPVEEPRFV